MARKKKDKGKQEPKGPRITRVIWDDLNSGLLRRSVRDDFRAIYDFYVDGKTREKHRKMGRFRRLMHGSWAVLKGMIYKLNSVRRLLLVLSLILMFIVGNITIQENGNLQFNTRAAAYFILLIVLLLELKDKLLARDELAAGRKVQFALLPKDPPEISGWDVWLYTRPANDVGGDLVDYLELGDGRWGLVLGDVAGKGLGAALYMAKLQAVWRLLAPDANSAAKLGERMNSSFYRDGLPNRFVSLIYLDIREESGKVKLMNAGHLPLLARQGNKFTVTSQGGPALGLTENSLYTEESIEFQAGEVAFIYSDGLTEAKNNEDQFYGEERLQEIFKEHSNKSVEEAGEAILADVDAFIREEKASDDISMILIKRR